MAEGLERAGSQASTRGSTESAWLAGWEAGFAAASAETICAVLERELAEMDAFTWEERRARAIALLRRELVALRGPASEAPARPFRVTRRPRRTGRPVKPARRARP